MDKPSELEVLIADYGDIDAKIKELSKIQDSEKTRIKEIMESKSLNDASFGGYKVTYTSYEKTSLDEGKALAVLKEDWAKRYGDLPCPYIKTKEVIDMDELESVLYANELPADTMKALHECETIKIVTTLKCGKAKPKKEEE